MTSNLQTDLQAAGREDNRYALHSFRVGGEASHRTDGTAMDVLMTYVEWRSTVVADRYVGVTAFIDADALSLSEGFVESYAAFPREDQRQPNPQGARFEVLG